MDGFKSIIIHNFGERSVDGHLLFDFTPGGDCFEGAEMDTNGIYFYPEIYGWNNGGLERLFKTRDCYKVTPPEPMFFRGHALFDNIDDAKNFYLMDPYMDVGNSDDDENDHAHVPFGMVIPYYSQTKIGGLNAVTVIIFWQDV